MAIIEMHSSWLAINSILGCPNGCKYCLLQATNNNIAKPKELATPYESVDALLKSKYYDKKIPLCLLPNTDVFVTKSNINYLLKLLDEIENRNIKNDLIIITKCEIPESVIKKVLELKKKGHNFIFYISYSGLPKEIEPNISKQILIKNFKILKQNNIDVIHYYRPFLPHNSSKESIDRVINEVNKYTDISVITGFALIQNFIDKIDFWPDILNNKEKCLKANCVWPKTAWEFFNNDYKKNQYVFQTNTCGLYSKLKRPSYYYGSYECLNYNHCSKEQRYRCKKRHELMDKITQELNCYKLLKKLGYDISSIDLRYDIYNNIVLNNANLNISDLSYLSYMLETKVYITNNNILENTYNSTLNGAKPLVLGTGVKYE